LTLSRFGPTSRPNDTRAAVAAALTTLKETAMTPTLASTSPVKRRSAASGTTAPARRRRERSRLDRNSGRDRTVLGRYTDRYGRVREVIARDGAAGSVLVLDRDRATHGDRRLVAHLAGDEPAENAALVCARYLQDGATDGSRCRLVTADDLRSTPFAEQQPDGAQTEALPADTQLVDRVGNRYALELVQSGMSIPELRWCRRAPELEVSGCAPVCVREVVGALESYEPVFVLTRRALLLHDGAGEVSTALLRAELVRVQESPIVLNRRLREAVLAKVQRDALSMSEIAIRCGRLKRDRRGNASGETSWLARRLGLLAEGGQSTPTPWIHSDVLALIARRGLGISPRDVEL
jgi:hypothetical protein